MGVANKETDYTDIDVLQLTLLMDSAWKSIERMQIVKALEESEQKFRTSADSSPTAILMCQNDKWIYANPAAQNISGYDEKELLQIHFWDIVHPSDKAIIVERGRKRQKGEKTVDKYEFRIVSKSGETKWVYLSGASIQRYTRYCHDRVS